MIRSRSSLLERAWPSRRFLLAFLLGALALLAGLGLLALSGWFISAAAIAGASAASAIAFDIFRPGALIRACAIVRTASRYGERLLSHDAVLQRLAELRVQAFHQLTRLAPEPLAKHADGDLLQRMVADIDTLDEGPLRVWLPLGWALLVAIASVLLIALADASLVTVALPWILAACLLAPLATWRQSLRANQQLAELAGRRRNQTIEWLRGLTTLLLCGAWQQRRRDWEALDREVVDGRLRQRLIEAGGLAFVILCVGVAAWLLLLRGESLIASQVLSTPMLAMAVLATLATIEAFTPAAAAMQAWSRTRAASQRLDELMKQPEQIVFAENGPALKPGHPAITLKDVSHIYAATSGDVSKPYSEAGTESVAPASGLLRGLVRCNLHIAAGSRIVISGPSGSGKSTLAALLARTLDTQQGCILIDAINIRHLNEPVLRESVALLQQRPHLFAMSLADNLRLADPNADDERLLAALDAVALGAFVRALPLGLATPIGEYGVGLSGGEARRVALARTLLTRATVVILDEPFEGLDDINRAQIISAIDAWLGKANVIVISHHPITFGPSTRQLQIVAGRIVSDSGCD